MFFADTGSKYTLITLDFYHQSMGKVVAAKCMLRAWDNNNVQYQYQYKQGGSRKSLIDIVGGRPGGDGQAA